MESSSTAMSDVNRYLIFVLKEESYAVNLEIVREVIALGAITPIPNAAPHFEGVLNLRGQVIAILDMRKKLKMPSAPATEESTIIILDFSPSPIGIIVDSVSSVAALSQDQISSPPEIGSKSEGSFTKGIARVGKSLIILLDIGLALNLPSSSGQNMPREKLLKSA